MKNLSPITRYLIGLAFWMGLYIVAVIFDGYYFRDRTLLGEPQAPWLYLFAVMPALPIGGTIWVVLRYMEESDEYVRALLTRRFVLATGATLFITTAWGFLQNYAGLQQFPLYYVYMLFWVSFGIISPFIRSAR